MHRCTEEEFVQKFPDIDQEYYLYSVCLDDLSKGKFKGTLDAPDKNFFVLQLHRCDTFED